MPNRCGKNMIGVIQQLLLSLCCLNHYSVLSSAWTSTTRRHILWNNLSSPGNKPCSLQKPVLFHSANSPEHQCMTYREKVWDISSFVLAHLTTLLSKFNTKPQVGQKVFLNICGSLSYLCPQTICPLRYPKAVTVFKKSASTETESSKQSVRLNDFILSASILWFYLLILISLRPPIS